VAVCSDSHMRHISTLCGENQEYFNAEAGGRGRDSSVGTATGWTAGVRFPEEARLFASPQLRDRL
jgi:hypothetical protein